MIKPVLGKKPVVNKLLIDSGEKHQAPLEKLICSVTNTLVLIYPDFSKDFKFHVDASKDALGCALYQQQQDQLRVTGLTVEHFLAQIKVTAVPNWSI